MASNQRDKIGRFMKGNKFHCVLHSEETKLKCRIATKKRWQNGFYNQRPRHSEKTKEKIRNTLIKLGLMIGEKCPNWKGGITHLMHKMRESAEYKSWRRSIFIRDEFTCKRCGKTHIYLEAHHLKSFANYPKLRFNINNGITVCIQCHSDIDKHRKRLQRKEAKRWEI